jgi:hypothetical protein
MDAPKVSVAVLLPEDAKQPLDKNKVILWARGIERPTTNQEQGTIRRLAIELCKANGWA